jgi:hypothetical protein
MPDKKTEILNKLVPIYRLLTKIEHISLLTETKIWSFLNKGASRQGKMSQGPQRTQTTFPACSYPAGRIGLPAQRRPIGLLFGGLVYEH